LSCCRRGTDSLYFLDGTARVEGSHGRI
jgi:hypothetical protein